MAAGTLVDPEGKWLRALASRISELDDRGLYTPEVVDDGASASGQPGGTNEEVPLPPNDEAPPTAGAQNDEDEVPPTAGAQKRKAGKEKSVKPAKRVKVEASEKAVRALATCKKWAELNQRSRTTKEEVDHQRFSRILNFDLAIPPLRKGTRFFDGQRLTAAQKAAVDALEDTGPMHVPTGESDASEESSEARGEEIDGDDQEDSSASDSSDHSE